ncbi:AMP-binding protein [Luedemannella helvata]|uniref:Carrier domain-containing protein n=1 Tax=Luedemannella helvata TaxID=349315 RepID=A0ABN2KXM7_9ACTN
MADQEWIRTLTGIWQDVLGLDDIAPDEHFLDLGGDSMVATEVVTRVRTATGEAVSVRSLFDHPTIAELAEFLAARGGAGARRSLWGGPSDPPSLVAVLRDTAHACLDQHAVIDGDLVLSYAQLFGWARDIAAVLGSHGVRPGDRVAVACPRGGAAVASMLAAIGTGAVYVPLDREYPQRRLAHMVSDSAPVVVLDTDGAAGRRATEGLSPAPAVVTVPDPAGVRPYDPVADGGWWWRPDDRPGDHPVYIIYTSGSTGWPKGVPVAHECLDTMVEWQATFSPAPDLRTAQFAPLNFDVFFQETLGTLYGGGTLVVVPESMRREPGDLLRLLGDHRVERLFLPYVALQMLATAATGEDLRRLTLVEVNVAGEQLVCTRAIRALFAALPRCRLVNHYGQSECAMVTAHILGSDPAAWPDLPPIGRPLPGCEVFVDPVDGDPAVGELLVAGRPVPAGYLGRPELDAERFLAIEPSAHGSRRAFRTGDLVRLDGDALTFLTRRDDEVKIRGVRVNLLEIDSQLLADPDVASAASVVVTSPSGARSLRAAVVATRPEDPPATGRLLAALAATLPEVSVPASITVLAELPRTPSGKIDRDAVARQVAENLADRRAARTATVVG